MALGPTVDLGVLGAVVRLNAMFLLADLLRLLFLPSTTATAPAVRFLAAVASGDPFPQRRNANFGSRTNV